MLIQSPFGSSTVVRRSAHRGLSRRSCGLLLLFASSGNIGCGSLSSPITPTAPTGPTIPIAPQQTFGSSVTDDFARPDGDLGLNWSILSNFGGSDGGIQLLNHAFAPSGGPQTKFPTSIGTWVGGGTFGPNQYAKVQLSAIAPEQSVVAVTAATSSSHNTIYSYTLTSGQALQTPQAINITGMAAAGNNGNFVISALDSETFTVPNSHGVAASGQTGTGVSATDSLGGPVVRSTAGELNGYYVYIGNNSGYVANNNGTTDGRVYVYELWKAVNGKLTDINEILVSTSIPDSPGDIFYIFALGDKVAFYKNNLVRAVNIDTSLTSGTPGIVVNSATGAGNKMPLGANLGVGGTQFTNWVGSDLPSTPTGWVAQASETFTTPGPAPNPPWAQLPHFPVVPKFAGLGGNNAGEADFEGISSLVYTGRTWADDQSSSVVMSNVEGKTSIDVMVRAATNIETFYVGEFSFPNGLGAGTFKLEKYIDGTVTILVTAPGTVNFADVLRLEVVGTTLTFKQNATTVLTASDSDIISGSPGTKGGGNANIMFWEGDEAPPAQ